MMSTIRRRNVDDRFWYFSTIKKSLLLVVIVICFRANLSFQLNYFYLNPLFKKDFLLNQEDKE